MVAVAAVNLKEEVGVDLIVGIAAGGLEAAAVLSTEVVAPTGVDEALIGDEVVEVVEIERRQQNASSKKQ